MKARLSDFAHVPPGGYAWWYFDAVSDDGRHACSAIFFIGSVFSPDYAARLRRGEAARAEEHVAVNLAVYERGRPRVWVMSEYGERALDRSGGGLRIGDSGITRSSDGKLRVELRERTAPFLMALVGAGARVAGSLELEPLGPSLPPIDLDTGLAPIALAPVEQRSALAPVEQRSVFAPVEQRSVLAPVEQRPAHAPGGPAAVGGHVWQARVPRARFRLRLEQPRLAFDGVGYHDVNAGSTRLEGTFDSWSWARFHDGTRTTIGYAVRGRDGNTRGLVAEAGDDGATSVAATLVDGAARPAGWGLTLPRSFTLTPAGGAPRVCTPTQIWDAAPFYARYAATLSDGSRRVDGIGEHLDLRRFGGRGIQFLLRFKTRLQRG